MKNYPLKYEKINLDIVFPDEILDFLKKKNVQPEEIVKDEKFWVDSCAEEFGQADAFEEGGNFQIVFVGYSDNPKASWEDNEFTKIKEEKDYKPYLLVQHFVLPNLSLFFYLMKKQVEKKI
ncbi:hypothetical protein KY306_01800, partial [Candidatus Woesearchaeota archaeon]|nr:hypothetical protein [Candidatus Woesearchaeota archaeon]